MFFSRKYNQVFNQVFMFSMASSFYVFSFGAIFSGTEPVLVNLLSSWLDCYLRHSDNLTLPIVSLLSCPLMLKWSLLGEYLLRTELILPDILCDKVYGDTLCLSKSSYFLPNFLKAKNDDELVLSHFHSWANSLCSHLWNNLSSSQEWIPQIWFNILIRFSQINSSLPTELVQHHQRWLIIALIALTCLLTVSFFVWFQIVFEIDFPKCHTSNWCNISGYFLLKFDVIWTCQSIFNVVFYWMWRFFKQYLQPFLFHSN